MSNEMSIEMNIPSFIDIESAVELYLNNQTGDKGLLKKMGISEFKRVNPNIQKFSKKVEQFISFPETSFDVMTNQTMQQTTTLTIYVFSNNDTTKKAMNELWKFIYSDWTLGGNVGDCNPISYEYFPITEQNVSYDQATLTLELYSEQGRICQYEGESI